MTLLYLISPPRITLAEFLPQAEAAMAHARVGSFQLRLKDASDAEILEAGKALKDVCARTDTAFILNDRPDLAAQLGCDGVHLGQEDLERISIAETRRILGEDAVIGVTCHASGHLAMEAGEQGADYVAFGAFYPTTSKPQEKLEKWGTPEVGMLAWWSRWTTVPCVAIGGITPQNCGPLVRAGADFIAAINGVWNDREGPEAAVEAYDAAIITSAAA